MKKPMWLGMLLVLLSIPLSPGVAHATPSTPGAGGAADRTSFTTMSASEFERRLFNRTNARRDRHGCRPLRLNDALQLAALRHSTRMADENELSHRLADEPSIDVRAESAGYTNWRLLAENLAWGQATPRQVFRDWVRSPGHRANLDNCRLRDVGYSVVIRGGQPWITQDFGRRLR